MNLEHFIARRTNSSSQGDRPTIMLRVARVAVALSVGVMIITLAVIFGFKGEIWSRLTGLSAHVVVCDAQGVDPSNVRPIRVNGALMELIDSLGTTSRVTSYISRAGVVKSASGVDGIVVKGVDSLFNTPFFEDAIVRGALPHFGRKEGATREILLSESTARALSLELGDRVEILFSDENQQLRRELFKLAATYSTGMEESDKVLALVDIAHLRRANGWGADQISGLEIWLGDRAQADRFAGEFNFAAIYNDRIGDRIGCFSISELYPTLIGWLAAHDMNGVVVIVIMFIVAAFNMITALLILVLEKRSMILTLKALGMGNGALQRIFIYRAAYLLLWALLWGNSLAVALCLAQQRWGLMRLDSSGYMLSQVPISLSVGWIAALNAGVVVMILAVMIVPTRLVSSIKSQ